MRHRALREREALFKECNRTCEIISVGQRTGHDDTPLRHQLCTRRRSAQFVPKFPNLRPLTHCAIAIRENRMLIGGVTQQTKRFEFTRCRLPLLLAIQRDSIQFVHRGHSRSLINELFQDAGGITESFCFKVFCGFS